MYRKAFLLVSLMSVAAFIVYLFIAVITATTTWIILYLTEMYARYFM